MVWYYPDRYLSKRNCATGFPVFVFFFASGSITKSPHNQFFLLTVVAVVVVVIGKTTLLDSLRGTIPLLDGDRIENPSLCLGVFTQDLAQELDVTARAVDLVTEYARSGDDGDITISDEDARSVMGGLGLTGDKALRLVGDLSGGEKG